MAPLRAGPWFLAGACLTAGDLAALKGGFRAGLPHGQLPFSLLLISAFLALLHLRWRRRGSRPPGLAVLPGVDSPPWSLLAACFTAGLALGVAGGRVAVASCSKTLASGRTVRVTGAVSSYVPRGESRRSRRRIRLRRARVHADSGVCRVGAVTLLVGERALPVPAPGRGVVASGRWWTAARGARRETPAPVRAVVLADSVTAIRAVSSGLPSPRGSAAGASRPLRLRMRAARRLERRLPRDVAPLARALLLADRDDLSPDLRRRFADAGLAHLLAVSGLHVGILAGGLAWILGLLLPGGGHRWRWPAAALLTAGYVAWIGAPPSAVRAEILLAGWATCRARGSPVGAADLLGAAAAAVLVVAPASILEPGFQLSYAGFGGLVVGASAAGRWRRGGPLRLLGAATGAWLLTAPVVALHFGRLAPIAAVSGLVCAPLVGAAVPALVATLLLPGLPAAVASWVAVATLRMLAGAAALLAGLPGGHGEVAPPALAEWLALALALVGLFRLAAGRPPRRAVIPLAGAVAVWLAWPATMAGWSLRGESLLCVLDVGQGDAVVVRTRRRHWIVVDAGPATGSRNAGRSVVVPFLRARGARAVDLFVLTHPHTDHLGGAGAVLDGFRVGTVLDAGVAHPGRAYDRFLAAVEAEGARWRAARPGARFRLDEVEGLVLGPVEPPAGAGRGRASRREPGPGRDVAGVRVPRTGGWSHDPNETSVVIRLRLAGRFTALLPGDAGADEERGILARWPGDSLRAAVLKVGHHGSRGSSTRPWLRAVAPELAVISSGEGNRYGHPHPALLDRLDSAGVSRVWRTDRRGSACVHVRRDGAWRLAAGG